MSEEAAAFERLERMLEVIVKDRSDAKGVVRVDGEEMKTLRLLLRGDDDGKANAVVRLASLERAKMRDERVLYGPPEKQADGLIAAVNNNSKAINFWVRLQWLIGGGVSSLFAKALYDVLTRGS